MFLTIKQFITVAYSALITFYLAMIDLFLLEKFRDETNYNFYFRIFMCNPERHFGPW
jgi:hypothetical protein